MSADALRQLLTGTGPLLLDFDGPVCKVFAGHPAPDIAAQLRSLVTARGIRLDDATAAQTDPMEVLRWTQQLGEWELTRAVEEALCRAELAAVSAATPTPYGRETIVAARQAGKRVAVVSNNSAASICAYLDAHRIRHHIAVVQGRAYAEPSRMKPNPDSVLRATSALKAAPHECVLLGDSVGDIVAGHAAGMPVIGYANKPAKHERFTQAGAEAIVASMAEIALVLLEESLTD